MIPCIRLCVVAVCCIFLCAQFTPSVPQPESPLTILQRGLSQSVSVSTNVTCGVARNGVALCWGRGLAIGYASTAPIATADVTTTTLTAAALSPGGKTKRVLATSVVCLNSGVYDCRASVILEDNTVHTWGSCMVAGCGLGRQATFLANTAPATIVRFPQPVNALPVQVSSGLSHSCVLFSDGTVRCFGSASNGQLGIGIAVTTHPFLTATAPVSIASSMLQKGKPISVACGGQFTCILLSSGDVTCAGRNTERQLGSGTTDSSTFEKAVVNTRGIPFVQITAGEFFACALNAVGEVYCWGTGAGWMTVTATPVRVTLGTSRTVQIAAMRTNLCVLTDMNEVHCTGLGANTLLTVDCVGCTVTHVAAGPSSSSVCVIAGAGSAAAYYCAGNRDATGTRQTTDHVQVAKGPVSIRAADVPVGAEAVPFPVVQRLLVLPEYPATWEHTYVVFVGWYTKSDVNSTLQGFVGATPCLIFQRLNDTRHLCKLANVALAAETWPAIASMSVSGFDKNLGPSYGLFTCLRALSPITTMVMPTSGGTVSLPVSCLTTAQTIWDAGSPAALVATLAGKPIAVAFVNSTHVDVSIPPFAGVDVPLTVASSAALISNSEVPLVNITAAVPIVTSVVMDGKPQLSFSTKIVTVYGRNFGPPQTTVVVLVAGSAGTCAAATVVSDTTIQCSLDASPIALSSEVTLGVHVAGQTSNLISVAVQRVNVSINASLVWAFGSQSVTYAADYFPPLVSFNQVMDGVTLAGQGCRILEVSAIRTLFSCTNPETISTAVFEFWIGTSVVATCALPVFQAPIIQHVTPPVIVAGQWVSFVGISLGVPTLDNLGAPLSAGFENAVGDVFECTAIELSSPLGSFISCLTPEIMFSGEYRTFVRFGKGLNVTSTGVVSYQLGQPFKVAWDVVGVPTALASSPAYTEPFSTPITITLDVVNLVRNAAVCFVGLSVSAQRGVLIGATMQIPVSDGTRSKATFDVGVTGDPGNYSMYAWCTVGNKTGTTSALLPIIVQLPTVQIVDSSSAFCIPAARALPTYATLANVSIRVTHPTGKMLKPLACHIRSSIATVANGNATTSVTGTATFRSLILYGSPGTAVDIVAVCFWDNNNYIASLPITIFFPTIALKIIDYPATSLGADIGNVTLEMAFMSSQNSKLKPDQVLPAPVSPLDMTCRFDFFQAIDGGLIRTMAPLDSPMLNASTTAVSIKWVVNVRRALSFSLQAPVLRHVVSMNCTFRDQTIPSVNLSIGIDNDAVRWVQPPPLRMAFGSNAIQSLTSITIPAGDVYFRKVSTTCQLLLMNSTDWLTGVITRVTPKVVGVCQYTSPGICMFENWALGVGARQVAVVQSSCYAGGWQLSPAYAEVRTPAVSVSLPRIVDSANASKLPSLLPRYDYSLNSTLVFTFDDGPFAWPHQVVVQDVVCKLETDTQSAAWDRQTALWPVESPQQLQVINTNITGTVRVTGPANGSLPIRVACSGFDFNEVSGALNVTLMGVTVQARALPAYTVASKLPPIQLSLVASPSASLTIPVATTTFPRLLPADFACITIPSNAAVRLDTGAWSSFNTTDGTISYSAVASSSLLSDDGTAPALLDVECIFRGMRIGSTGLALQRQPVFLAWDELPPISVVPRLGANANTFNFSLILRRNGVRDAEDNYTECVAAIREYSNGTSKFLNSGELSIIGGAASARGGLVKFSSASLIAPFGVAADLTVSCRFRNMAPLLYLNTTITTSSPVVSVTSVSTIGPQNRPPVWISGASGGVVLSLAWRISQVRGQLQNTTLQALASSVATVYCGIDVSSDAADGWDNQVELTTIRQVPMLQNRAVLNFTLDAPMRTIVTLRPVCMVGNTSIPTNAISVVMAAFQVLPSRIPAWPTTYVPGNTLPALQLNVSLVPTVRTIPISDTAISVVSKDDFFCAAEANRQQNGLVMTVSPLSMQTNFLGTKPYRMFNITLVGVNISPILEAATAAAPSAVLTVTCFLKKQQIGEVKQVLIASALKLAWAAVPPVAVRPSSPSSIMTLTAISVRLLDTANQLVRQNQPTCYMSIPNAWDNKGSALHFTAVEIVNGVAPMASGTATFQNWGIIAPPLTVMQLAVTCYFSSGYFPVEIFTTVATTALAIDKITTTSIMPQALRKNTDIAAIFDVTERITVQLKTMTPANAAANKATYTVQNYDSSAFIRTTCSARLLASATGPFPSLASTLGSNAKLYSNVSVAIDGTAILDIRPYGIPGASMTAEVSCFSDIYKAENITAVAITVVQISSRFIGAFPSAFKYNGGTALPLFVLRGQIDATEIAFAVNKPASTDIACALQGNVMFNSRLTPVDIFGGAITVNNTGHGTIAPIFVKPPYYMSFATLSVSFVLNCTLKRVFPFTVSTFSLTMRAATLSWMLVPPIQCTPSTATSKVLLPTISATLSYNGVVDTSDSLTPCWLVATSGIDASGKFLSQGMLSIDKNSAVVSAGTITFKDWSLYAPPNSTVFVNMTCIPHAGGPTAVLQFSIATTSFDVNGRPEISSLGLVWKNEEQPVVMYGFPVTVTQLTKLMIPTNSGRSNFLPTTYTSSSIRPLCRLRLITSMVKTPLESLSAGLGGDPANYTGVPVGLNGTVALTFTPLGLPSTVLPLVVECYIMDTSIIVASPVFNVTIGSIASRWMTAPPTSYRYNSSIILPRVQFSMVMNEKPLTLLRSDLDPEAIRCSTQAFMTLGGLTRPVSLSGGFSLSGWSNASVALFPITIRPPFRDEFASATVQIIVNCTLLSSFPIAESAFTVWPADVYLQWVGTPPLAIPSSFASSPIYLPTLAVSLRDRQTNQVIDERDMRCHMQIMQGVDRAQNVLPLQRFAVVAPVAQSVNGTASFTSWYVTAPPASLLYLSVKCWFIQDGPMLDINTTLATHMLGLRPLLVQGWDTANMVLYDTPFNVTAQLAVLVPKSRQLLTSDSTLYKYNTSLIAPASCSIRLDYIAIRANPALLTAELVGDPLQYASVPVDPKSGNVSLIVAVKGEENASIPLLLFCATDAQYEPAVISSFTVRIASVTMKFMGAVPQAFQYNSPLAIPLIEFRTATPANKLFNPFPYSSSDIICSTVATSFSRDGSIARPSPFTGGLPDNITVTKSSSMLAVSRISLQPQADDVGSGFFVQVSFSCMFRFSFPLGPVALTMNMARLALDWVIKPPPGVLLSASTKYVNLPRISVRLMDRPPPVTTTGATATPKPPRWGNPPVAPPPRNVSVPVVDVPMTCSLEATAGRDENGNRLPGPQYSVVALPVPSVLGYANFTTWSLIAPPMSRIDMIITCVLSSGGADVVENATIIANGASVGMNKIPSADTLNPNQASVVLYDAITVVEASVNLSVPIDSTNPSRTSVVPYSSSIHPAIFCTLTLNTTGLSQADYQKSGLSGEPVKFQAVPVGSNGKVKLETRIRAPLRVTLTLRISCQYSDIQSLQFYSQQQITVATLSMQWDRIMPSFIFNTAASYTTVQLLAVIAGNGKNTSQDRVEKLNTAGIVTTDILCVVAAVSNSTGSRRAVPFTGADVQAMQLSTAKINISGIALQPIYSVDSREIDDVIVTISLDCTFRGAFQLPTIAYETRMRRLTLRWVARPPRFVIASSASRTYPLQAMSVEVLDGASRLSTDSTSRCAVLAYGISAGGTRETGQDVNTGTSPLVTVAKGIAAFTFWHVIGPLDKDIGIEITCERAEGGPTMQTSAQSTITTAFMTWTAISTRDPSGASHVVLYDSPSFLQARLRLQQRDVTTYALRDYSSDTAPESRCTVGLEQSTDLNARLGGDPSDYKLVVNRTGFIDFPVRVQAIPEAVVDLILGCRFGDADILPIRLRIVVSPISIRILRYPPLLIVPSVYGYLLPKRNVAAVQMIDQFGIPTADDPAATCSLDGTILSQTRSEQSIDIVGLAKQVKVAANATVTFDQLSFVAPIASDIRLYLSCSRSAVGSPVSRIAVESRTASARVVWHTPPATKLLANSPYTVQARVEFQMNLGPNEWQPYNVSAFGPASCFLRLRVEDQSEGISLGGGALALSSALDRAGIATFTLIMQAKSGQMPHVFASCSILGTTTDSNMSVSIVQQLAVAFAAPPPNTWWPNSISRKSFVQPPPRVFIVDAFDRQQIDNAGVACEVTVNRATWAPSSTAEAAYPPNLIDVPTIPYTFTNSSNGVILNQVAPGAWWGTTVLLAISCLRVEGEFIPPLEWPIRMRTLNISWVNAPPVNVATQKGFGFRLEVLDQGVRFLPDNFTTCVAAAKGAVVRQSSEVIAEMGLITFEDVSIIGKAGDRYDIVVNCKYGDIPYVDGLQASIVMNGCPGGHEPIGDGTVCGVCPADHYSNGGNSRCARCPAGVFCSGGILTPLPNMYLANADSLMQPRDGVTPLNVSGGRYVINSFVPDMEFHACWNPQSCLVNITEGSYGCAPGYTGVLCGVCDMESGWVQQGTKCSQCMPRAVNVLFLFAASVFFVLLLIYISIYAELSSSSQARTVWRILVNYISALSAFGIYVAKGTATFLDAVNIMQSVFIPGGGSGLDISPIQCELQLGFYTRFATKIGFPIIAAIVCILINVAYIVIRKYETGLQSMRQELAAFWRTQKQVAVAALVVFMAYPSLTSQAFTMFTCMRTPIGGVHYLEIDLSVNCDTKEHQLGRTLAWLLIALMCGGLPALFAFWLWKHETTVRMGSTTLFYQTFGFLYQGYRTDRWYLYSWEAIVMVRKAFIIAIAATTKDAVYQIGASTVLLVVAFGLQLHIAPYSRLLFNYLEAITLFALIGTQCVSLLYMRTQDLLASEAALASSRDSKDENTILLHDLGATALLILLNLATILLLIYYFLMLRRAELAAKSTCMEFLCDVVRCKKRDVNHHLDELTSRLDHQARRKSINPLSLGGTNDPRVRKNPLTSSSVKPMKPAARRSSTMNATLPAANADGSHGKTKIFASTDLEDGKHQPGFTGISMAAYNSAKAGEAPLKSTPSPIAVGKPLGEANTLRSSFIAQKVTEFMPLPTRGKAASKSGILAQKPPESSESTSRSTVFGNFSFGNSIGSRLSRLSRKPHGNFDPGRDRR